MQLIDSATHHYMVVIMSLSIKIPSSEIALDERKFVRKHAKRTFFTLT